MKLYPSRPKLKFNQHRGSWSPYHRHGDRRFKAKMKAIARIMGAYEASLNLAVVGNVNAVSSL